jgi:nucleoside-diphosphate-sugar epimerase
MIVMTGRTGSLGSVFPKTVEGLKTRLESTGAVMLSELKTFREIPDVLIHSAALVPVQKCNEKPALAQEVNVAGSEKWFRAAAQIGVSRFIYISTSHIFEPRAESVLIKPDAQAAPASVYGKTKLEAEKKLQDLAQQFPNTELFILRVFSLLSPEMRPGFLYTDLHRRARAKDLSPIAGLRNLRDFIRAEDACARIMKIAESPQAKPGIYHVCTGQGRTIEDLARAVFKNFNVDTSGITEDPSTTHKPSNTLLGEPTLLPDETSFEFTSVSGEREQYRGRS